MCAYWHKHHYLYRKKKKNKKKGGMNHKQIEISHISYECENCLK